MQLANAALRHKRCAMRLAARQEQAQAGYLIGLAAECALKYHMQGVGFVLIRARRRNRKTTPDPLFLHFPDLQAEFLSQGQGILGASVARLLADPQLFNGWTVKMRYRDEKSSPAIVRRYERWLEQTDRIFAEVGI